MENNPLALQVKIKDDELIKLQNYFKNNEKYLVRYTLYYHQKIKKLFLLVQTLVWSYE